MVEQPCLVLSDMELDTRMKKPTWAETWDWRNDMFFLKVLLFVNNDIFA